MERKRLNISHVMTTVVLKDVWKLDYKLGYLETPM